jgi:protein phosphatase
MATSKATNINIPGSALVVLIGVAGAGKSTFANARFRPTEILSSDQFRAMVSDDPANQEATDDAFLLLHLVLEKRLRRGKLCVVDATNLRPEHRAKLIGIANLCKRPPVAIVFDTPAEMCIERAGQRVERIVRAEIIRDQWQKISAQMEDDLLREGFHTVVRIKPDERIETQRMVAASGIE